MRWPECGTADAGAPRDELDLAASMIRSRNGPHARHSPSHEQPGLYLRSARRFLQAPRENDAAQPLLADLGGFLDQRFGGADGAVVVRADGQHLPAPALGRVADAREGGRGPGDGAAFAGVAAPAHPAPAALAHPCASNLSSGVVDELEVVGLAHLLDPEPGQAEHGSQCRVGLVAILADDIDARAGGGVLGGFEAVADFGADGVEVEGRSCASCARGTRATHHVPARAGGLRIVRPRH